MYVTDSILGIDQHSKFSVYFATVDTSPRYMGCIRDLRHLSVAVEDVALERTL